MNEIPTVITSAKGYLLNFHVNQSRIQLDQFKYNPTIKNFDLFSQDFLNLESEIFIFDKANRIINDKDSIILFGLADNVFKKAIVVVYNEMTENFKFDIQLSLEITEIFDFNSKSFHLKLFTKDRKFFYFNFIYEEKVLKLKFFHNLNNQLDFLSYQVDVVNNLNKIESLNWTNINDECDETFKFLNFKLLTFLKVEISSQINVKSFLIDPFRSISPVNSSEFLKTFSIFNKFDTSLIEENDTTSLLCLSKNYSNQSIDLTSISITDFQLFLDHDGFTIKGSCILNIFYKDHSFILALENGSEHFKHKINRKLFQIENYKINNKDNYLLISDGIRFYQIFTLEENGIKSVYESDHITSVLIDFFTDNTEHFLIINDLILGDFVLKKDFDYNHQNSDEHNFDLTSDFHDVSIDFTSVNNKNENYQPLDDKKPNYALDLIKLLEYKDRSSDLILSDVIRQVKQKFGLITEISNLFVHGDQSFNFTDKNCLPKLVELYAKKSEPNNTNRAKNNPQIKSFEIENYWTCYLNQNFLFNFVISKKIDKSLNDLNCALVVKGSKDDEKMLDYEFNQLIMRLDSKMLDLLKKEKFENLEDLLNFGKQVNESDHFLITLEFDMNFVNNLMANFNGTNFEIKLLINSENGSDFYRKTLPIKFNLIDNLVINKMSLNPRTYLSILNYYESSLMRSKLKLKIHNVALNNLHKVVVDQLCFENIFEIEDIKLVYFLNKQSLITDCFLMAENAGGFLKADIYTRNNEQLVLIVNLLKKFLSMGEETNFRIEIDIDNYVDNLIEALKNELDLYNKLKPDRIEADDIFDESSMETNSTDKNLTREDLIRCESFTDNEILNLFK
ncbi:unnamed protein product [Brachionus calyciflorus]|uniref:Uncharacterized protein n=1 Tax=Brachionus calyciflorus TaxID=104777 RepID=A0A813NLM0_9BILA|nr:unnamed protein product [Brachionus calyciflorus]